ncbi:DUF695 domain-containing protein [Neolewinella antarctica]|uniref:DUF695 domain-containing protein n=1 Tax=Neolewinella antarctica TaxID=442734 RepID=A0ABX0X9I5_9BACT|nr:DUF695 domain-containing protein [Neolewinella antarctica]NJC25929.1 hypothetical protein [Neolewinella antarctica]
MAAQEKAENWDAYIAAYENGLPGSTTLRMDLINNVPFHNFPFIVITGISYKTTREDRFPESGTLDFLYEVGEELTELITHVTQSLPVGSFTHDGERLEYFYVSDTLHLKEEIEKYYTQKHAGFGFHLKVEEDKDWTCYQDFLYPNQEILNYMADASVVENLKKGGDSLTKVRRVDHWLYFSTARDMKKCKKEVEEQEFVIHTSRKIKSSSLNFQLQIWRTDKVDIDSINKITSSLRKTAIKCDGNYDGWETSIEQD